MGYLSGSENFSIGQTVMGRDIECVKIGDINNKDAKVILFTFGLHGFDDFADGDAKYFKGMAESMINYYEDNPASLEGTILYIVPCVNIDGMINGISEYEFGRCNKNGYDLNRVFPSRWVKYTTSRNYNGDGPFPSEAPEALHLRDLVIDIKPDYVIDVHGYEGSYIGDADLAKIFRSNYKQRYTHDWDSKSEGYFSTWAELSGNAKKSLLVELPWPSGDTQKFFDKQGSYLLESCKDLVKSLTRKEEVIVSSSKTQSQTSSDTSSITSSKTQSQTSSDTSSITSSKTQSQTSSDTSSITSSKTQSQTSSSKIGSSIDISSMSSYSLSRESLTSSVVSIPSDSSKPMHISLWTMIGVVTVFMITLICTKCNKIKKKKR